MFAQPKTKGRSANVHVRGWAGNGGGSKAPVNQDGKLVRGIDGWLTRQVRYSMPAGQDLLAAHADWDGPVKLVETSGGVEQRIEFYMGWELDSGDDSLFDEEAARETQALQDDLYACARAFEERRAAADWQPPPANLLSGWLTEAGHEVAIDKDQNLRLQLKRAGCDGQVRIERGQGRLRFALPLGRWASLELVQEQAIRLLCREANARSRLVRIVWRSEGEAKNGEAQVDLSGLPLPSDGQEVRQGFWRGMVSTAVRALELSLRQLGLEIPALADPRNCDLAELLVNSTI